MRIYLRVCGIGALLSKEGRFYREKEKEKKKR